MGSWRVLYTWVSSSLYHSTAVKIWLLSYYLFTLKDQGCLTCQLWSAWKDSMSPCDTRYTRIIWYSGGMLSWWGLNLTTNVVGLLLRIKDICYGRDPTHNACKMGFTFCKHFMFTYNVYKTWSISPVHCIIKTNSQYPWDGNRASIVMMLLLRCGGLKICFSTQPLTRNHSIPKLNIVSSRKSKMGHPY